MTRPMPIYVTRRARHGKPLHRTALHRTARHGTCEWVLVGPDAAVLRSRKQRPRPGACKWQEAVTSCMTEHCQSETKHWLVVEPALCGHSDAHWREAPAG